jgi:hypothetical protein
MIRSDTVTLLSYNMCVEEEEEEEEEENCEAVVLNNK